MITRIHLGSDAKCAIGATNNKKFTVDVSDDIGRIFPIDAIDNFSIENNMLIIDSSFIFRCIKDRCSVGLIDNILMIRRMTFTEQYKHLDRIGAVKLEVDNNHIIYDKVYSTRHSLKNKIIIHGVDKSKNIIQQLKSVTVYTKDDQDNVKFIATDNLKNIESKVDNLIEHLQKGDYKIAPAQIFFNINNLKGDN